MNDEKALYTLGRAVVASKDNSRGTRWAMAYPFPDDCYLDDGVTPDVSRAEVAGILLRHILDCYAEHFEGNANFLVVTDIAPQMGGAKFRWQIRCHRGRFLADGKFQPFECLIYESALVAALEAFEV